MLIVVGPALAQADDNKQRRLHENARNCLLDQLYVRAEDPRCFSKWTIRMEVYDKACKGPIDIYFNYRREIAKDTPQMLEALRASWLEYWNDYMDSEIYAIQKKNGCF